MRPFTYIEPTNIEEALTAAASSEKSSYLGGGTNLVDLMKEDVERPSQLIDINSLSYGDIVKNDDGGYTLGATQTNSETASHPEIRKNYPLLSMATMLKPSTATMLKTSRSYSRP